MHLSWATLHLVFMSGLERGLIAQPSLPPPGSPPPEPTRTAFVSPFIGPLGLERALGRPPDDDSLLGSPLGPLQCDLEATESPYDVAAGILQHQLETEEDPLGLDLGSRAVSERPPAVAAERFLTELRALAT